MSVREVLAAAVLVWLIGAVVGWCAGWVGRGEHNRGWHAGVAHQLAQARADLARALDELDAMHHRWETERLPAPPPVPAPSVVHVHLAPGVGWASPPVFGAVEVLDAVPVLPAGPVGS